MCPCTWSPNVHSNVFVCIGYKLIFKISNSVQGLNSWVSQHFTRTVGTTLRACRKGMTGHKSPGDQARRRDTVQWQPNLHEMTCLASCWFIAILKYVSASATGISPEEGCVFVQAAGEAASWQREYAPAFCLAPPAHAFCRRYFSWCQKIVQFPSRAGESRHVAFSGQFPSPINSLSKLRMHAENIQWNENQWMSINIVIFP